MINIIKNNKTLRTIILVLLGLIAIGIIIWSAINKKTANKISDYNKYTQTNGTQPDFIYTGSQNPDYAVPAAGDRLFSEAIRSLYDKYPWYGKLPIENNDYVIIFDLDKTQFRIRLRISSNSQQSIKDSLTNKALNELRSIVKGDLDKYGYYIRYLD